LQEAEGVSSFVQNGAAPTVFIAADDPQTRAVIEAAVRSVGLRAEVFETVGELAGRARPDKPGCIILDIRPGGVTGEEVQRLLEGDDSQLPVIVVTGREDVAIAVQAMRAGALDVLARPISEQTLVDDVHRAIVHDRLQRERASEVRNLRERYVQLTGRAQEVMALVVAGVPNRQIASALGITERTVKAHRAQVMQKMMATSLVDLIRMARDLSGVDNSLRHPEAGSPSRAS
jgi:FixJ family two-component response regulator